MSIEGCPHGPYNPAECAQCKSEAERERKAVAPLEARIKTLAQMASDEKDKIIHQLEAERDEAKKLGGSSEGGCAYCSFRAPPETPLSVIKKHIETECKEHPLAKRITTLEAENNGYKSALLERADAIDKLQVIIAENKERIKQLEVEKDKLFRTSFRMDKRNAELEAGLREYGHHDKRCILSRWEAGRYTSDGGYEMKYAGKWYQSRPKNEIPKCTCGLTNLIGENSG